MSLGSHVRLLSKCHTLAIKGPRWICGKGWRGKVGKARKIGSLVWKKFRRERRENTWVSLAFFDCQKRRKSKHLVLALKESCREFIHFLEERVEALVICLGWKPFESSLCTFPCAFTCFFLVTSFRLLRKFLSICNHVLFVSLMEICLVQEYDAFFILGVIYAILLFFLCSFQDACVWSLSHASMFRWLSINLCMINEKKKWKLSIMFVLG